MLTDHRQPGTPIVFVNAAFTALTGYSFEEVVGRNCRFLQGAETDPRSVEAIRTALAAGRGIKLDLLNYRKNGEAFWNELLIGPEADETGTIVGFIGILNDITQKRKLETEAVELQARLASIVENMPGYVFQRSLKSDGTLGVTYASPSFAAVLGIPAGAEADIGDVQRKLYPEDREAARQAIAKSAADMCSLSIEFRLPGATGERWIRTYSKPRRLGNGDVIWDGIGLDITAEKRAEERLSYLAYHDPLTGMPNRTLFATSLARSLTASRTTQDQVALFILDLDGFQEVNDAAGMRVADSVLRGVSKRISDLADLREGYAARIGGDEFAVSLRLPPSGVDLLDIARRFCAELSLPLLVEGREFSIEACIGVAVFPFSSAAETLAEDVGEAELMQQANLALLAAKRAGRGMCRLYSSDGDDRLRNQLVFRASLRRAIEDQQFRLHYHPLVDLGSGRIVGAEALIRWSHPELGLQRPDLFIPLAERSGLIVPLGAWVLQEAMRQGVEWRRNGLTVPKIAINVSGLQLLDPGFLRMIERTVAETGAEPSQFEVELTEGFMIEASPTVLNVLATMKSMGFTLAVDDFGTGHSSFRYLRDFPVDKVKIDQTFVRQMVVDSSDASIIRAIIALARSLNLEVVAEGIETHVQRGFLRDEGCRTGQGYLFSLPLTAEDFGFLLERGITLPMSSSSEAVAAGGSKVTP